MASPTSPRYARRRPSRPGRATILRRRLVALAIVLFVLALIIGAANSSSTRSRRPAASDRTVTHSHAPVVGSAGSPALPAARHEANRRVSRRSAEVTNSATSANASASGGPAATPPSDSSSAPSSSASAPTSSCPSCASSGAQPIRQTPVVSPSPGASSGGPSTGSSSGGPPSGGAALGGGAGSDASSSPGVASGGAALGGGAGSVRRRHLAAPRAAQRFRLGADRQRATRPATTRIMRYRYLRQQSAEGHSSGPRGAALHSGYELGGRMRVDEVACAPIRSVWVLAIASTPTGYSTSTGAATSTSDPHKPPESVRAAPGIGLLGHAAGGPAARSLEHHCGRNRST